MIKKCYSLLISVLISSFSFVHSADFLNEQPDFLPPCEIYKPEFTKCSTNSIQHLFYQLRYGIPGLKTFDKIDPFYINKIQFDQNNNNVFSLNANISKVVVTGFNETIVRQSKVSKKDFSWETKLRVPKLRIEGNYVMNGRVLLVPLEGKGKMFLQADTMDVNMYTTTRLYEKGGFTFYNVTHVRVELRLAGLKTHLDNLFNGNKELGASINQFFNENWEDFFEAMRPIITNTVEEILLNMLQNVFHFIPANFFVSDIPTSVKLYSS